MWTGGERFATFPKGAAIRAMRSRTSSHTNGALSQMLQNISVLLQEDPDISNAFTELFPAHAARELTSEPNGAAGPVLGTLNGGPPVAHTMAAAAIAPAAPEPAPVIKIFPRQPPNGSMLPLPPAPPDA